MSERTKKLLRWSGSGLSILAIIFVIGKLQNYGDEIALSQPAGLWYSIMLLAMLYGCAGVIPALAWKDLLRHLQLSINWQSAIAIYGQSQLSKYIPGNVFQFVGRQALGLEAGLPMWPLAKSAVWELGVQAACGSLFLLLILPLYFYAVPVPLAVSLFGIALATALWASNRWIGPWVSRACAWHIGFLTVAGLLFYIVTLLVTPGQVFTFPAAVLVCGVYVIAWLAGLLTPGSPAGMGVRELVLFALLRTTIDEPELLVAIVLGRLVTLGGDVALFLLAHVLGLRTSKPA